jgi:hypothetical protein
LRAGLALLLLACAAASLAQEKSDWERENEERLRQSDEQYVAPPALERARLIELRLDIASGFRYYVDPGTVSVGPDRIVRYVMVARSGSAADNVTFEGLRCSGEYRVYAVGHADGSWGGRAGPWRPVPRDSRVGQYALLKNYFCPARGEAVASAAEAVNALRNGVHPAVQVLERR